jgi:CDP-diacylglycerol--glycerol-3-phosphate 3-phosphatidyltransferase
MIPLIVSPALLPSFDQQVLTVALPIVIFAALWITAFVIFKIDLKRRGQTAFDQRLESHTPSFFISRDFLLFIIWLGHPIKRTIIRFGITPNMITWVSVFFAAAGAVAAGKGWFAPAGMLFIVGGLCDVFDGWVARETGQVSIAGSFLDSLLDRVSEFFMFAGYIFYYAGRVESMIALVALGASQTFSYARAKGESLNLAAQSKGGVMGRSERVLSLSAASIAAPLVSLVIEEGSPRPAYLLFSIVLGMLAAFSVTSLFLRGRMIYRALQVAPANGDSGRSGESPASG